MKTFIIRYESTRKTRNKAVDRLLISYLVPEIPRFEDPKN